jgi:hypothetical protein
VSRSPSESLLLAVVGYLYSVNLFPVNVVLASMQVCQNALQLIDYQNKVQQYLSVQLLNSL